MTVLLEALARLVSLLALTLLAVAGGAAAIFCIQGGDGPLSLARLAALLGLDGLSREVGDLLSAVESAGPVAVRSALGGAAAVVVGVVLLVGALVPRRERLLTAQGASGRQIFARRRAIAQAAAALAEQGRGVTAAKGGARPNRRGGGGRLRVKATRARRSEDQAVRAEISGRLEELSSGFSLRSKIKTDLAQSRSAARAPAGRAPQTGSQSSNRVQ